MKPMPANPRIIMAHVEGSGTAVTERTVTSDPSLTLPLEPEPLRLKLVNPTLKKLYPPADSPKLKLFKASLLLGIIPMPLLTIVVELKARFPNVTYS
jgi:hypothetical protein